MKNLKNESASKRDQKLHAKENRDFTPMRPARKNRALRLAELRKSRSKQSSGPRKYGESTTAFAWLDPSVSKEVVSAYAHLQKAPRDIFSVEYVFGPKNTHARKSIPLLHYLFGGLCHNLRENNRPLLSLRYYDTKEREQLLSIDLTRGWIEIHPIL